MSRYVAILISLGLLGSLYWAVGGFDGSSPRPEAVPETAPAPTTASSALAEPTDPAAGGPDDGPALGMRPIEPGFSSLDPRPTAPGADVEDWEDVVIGRRESFYVALRRVGLEHETIMDLVDTSSPHTDLEKVKRGDRFMLARDGEDSFRALRFDLDRERYLVVEDAGDSLAAMVAHYPIEETVRAVRGRIETNLFEALLDQEADPTVADQMAEILGWDIDFFRDLRVGDEFVVIYREYRHDDEKVRDPQVLAVHFTNKGQKHRAYRFRDEHDLPAYYKPDGQSLERQFLRAPLKYTRISSGFTYRRLHPVLKRYRPHLGVDFVADPGTPVMATAAGVVIRRSYDRAGGHTVGLRHGNGYESYYLHLSKYPSGLRKGDRVEQGDVIGFVGSTGWATGAHLDYRIKKNGKWLNPKKLSLPPADPVAEDRLDEYRERVERLERLIAELPSDATTLVLNQRELAPEADLQSVVSP